jgi:hypothetical protein
MSAYPVEFDVKPVPRFTRVQLFVRLAALLALGMLGVSLGTVFWVGYLLLPIYAASRIASLGSAAQYARNDGPRVMLVLHWFAAVNAWAGLATEALPARHPSDTVHVRLEPTPIQSSPVAAILRIFTGFLSALALCLCGFLGMFIWIWAAISVLIDETIGARASSYLIGLQRWTLRLLAYQACLVDEYPPFSFRDGPRRAESNEQGIVAG